MDVHILQTLLVKEMDRQKFCNELNRETFLSGMGYQVICFAYDDVTASPLAPKPQEHCSAGYDILHDWE
ncbi:hypothetical protein B9T62_25400 [Paenibacillus donghaensis]|uniref:Uncharacterized protein n=1 Tax=Paenibacillus donghaensis TaxID=414771 RepID=A0A2Z2KD27_9BACL|nr:hypothetical protein B9T62_25400 [Paenibacillus donghaensis]